METTTLFHYTDAAGVIGIVRGQSLWASSLSHMNDSQEGHHGNDIVDRVLVEHAKDAPEAQAYVLRCAMEAFWLDPDDDGMHQFAFCMSEEEDLLSQWRGYTPTGGYAIGLRVSALKRIADRNGFRLDKCLYDDNSKTAAIAQSLAPAIASVEAWEMSDDQRTQFVRSLAKASARTRSTLKHPSFYEEREWRLHGPISSNDPRCNWRATGPYVRPYAVIPVPWVDVTQEPDLIVSVRIGPGLDTERAMAALKHLFDSRNMPRPEISMSGAPLR